MGLEIAKGSTKLTDAKDSDPTGVIRKLTRLEKVRDKLARQISSRLPTQQRMPTVFEENHKIVLEPVEDGAGHRRLALGDTTPSTVGIVSGIIALTGLLGFYLYRRFSRKRAPKKTDSE